MVGLFPISWSLRICPPPRMPGCIKVIWKCCGNLFGSRKGRYQWEILSIICNVFNVAMWVFEVWFVLDMWWTHRPSKLIETIICIAWSELAIAGSVWGVGYRLYMGV